MKFLRFIAFAIISLVLSSAAHAQLGDLRNDFAFGVNGGVVMSKVSFDPTISQAYKIGTTFGLTGRYTCERYFGMICAIQADLNITQMGWKEDLDPQYGNDTYSRNINYFQLPLLANLRFGKEYNGVSAYLVLGPQIGFAISNSGKKGGDWASTDYTDAQLQKRRPNGVIAQYSLPVQNKFDYGITGGLGIEFNNSRIGHICLEGRYYFGLSDIFNNSKTDTFGRSAHSAIYAKATYLFDLKQLKQYRKNKKAQKAASSAE